MESKSGVFITKSFEETKKFGEKFSHEIAKQDLSDAALVISLYGDLGSGKTTFVQGLARGLGIKRRIISPTFIIIRSYKLKAQNVKRKTIAQNLKLFYHIDLYRIKNERDTEALGLEEIINNPENIIAIEWAEKMGKLLPEKRWDIRFEHLDEEKRRITINLKTQISKRKTTV